MRIFHKYNRMWQLIIKIQLINKIIKSRNNKNLKTKKIIKMTKMSKKWKFKIKLIIKIKQKISQIIKKQKVRNTNLFRISIKINFK